MLSKLIYIATHFFFLIKYIVSSSNITIKINQIGVQSILFNDFTRNKSEGKYPTRVYLNGTIIPNVIYNISISSKGENIIILEWNETLDSINDMFNGCVNITEVDLSQFDSSKVTRMSGMFQNCISLIKVNFSNFNASLIEGMGSLFYNCKSLTSVDLSNFSTPKLNYMKQVFYNCSNLKSINLSNFDTSNLKSLNQTFYKCISLTSVDFQNLNMSKVNNTEKMFSGCSNLTHLNLKNYKERDSLDYFNIFNNTNNISICFNKTINPNLTHFIENNSYKLNYYNECFYFTENNTLNESYISENITKSLIKTSYPIINSEEINSDISDYEKNIIFTSYSEEKSTEVVFINKTQIINYNNSSDICLCSNNNCTIHILLNNGCNNIYFTENNKTGLGSLILNGILNGNIQKILKERNNIVFTNDDNIHQISKYSFQKENLNLSSLNLGECEEKIKSQTNINSTEDLFIYIIEHNLEGLNIPIIEYTLFTENSNNTFINLSLCENINIQIPVEINDNDIDKYDPSSEFYNDACNKHSNGNGVDMTLYDRKNEFNEKNMSLCEKDCKFINYNTSTKKVECDCLTKKNISLYIDDSNKGDLVSKINNNEKSMSNLKITECTNVLSSPEEIKSNTGFFLLLFILAIFIIVFIIFCVKGKSNLERKIDMIIYEQFEKNKDSNNNNKISKNKIKNGKSNKIGKKNQKIKNNEQSKTNSFKLMNKENIGKDNTKKLNSKNPKKLITNESLNNINKNQNNKTKIIKNKKIPKLNDYELNNLSYNEAINYDKRTACDYYCALIKNKQLFMFTFCSFNDYNSGIIKKLIFFLSFALHYTINALFFNDSNMHQIYEDGGSFNFSYQFPYILISALASTLILRLILETLVLTERSIVKIKKQTTYESAIEMKGTLMRNFNIKFAIFFVVNFVLLVAFWYYLTCFNAIYNNTQVYLIENTFISFAISLFFPVFYNIIPTCLRRCALSSENKDANCLYSISRFLQLI